MRIQHIYYPCHFSCFLVLWVQKQTSWSLDRNGKFLYSNFYQYRYNSVKEAYLNADYQLVSEYYNYFESKAWHSPEIFFSFGRSLDLLGRSRDVENVLKKAVCMEPALFKPRYVLLLYYMKEGMCEKASQLKAESLLVPMKLRNEQSLYYFKRIKDLII